MAPTHSSALGGWESQHSAGDKPCSKPRACTPQAQAEQDPCRPQHQALPFQLCWKLSDFLGRNHILPVPEVLQALGVRDQHLPFRAQILHKIPCNFFCVTWRFWTYLQSTALS